MARATAPPNLGGWASPETVRARPRGSGGATESVSVLCSATLSSRFLASGY
jgi:hypothetical protein